MFATLWSWLKREPKPPLPIVLYTRAGCHLCEDVWRQLQRAQSRYRLTLEQRDVDADPELATRYGDWVPVVVINGKERFRGRVNPVLLDRLLHAEAGRKP